MCGLFGYEGTEPPDPDRLAHVAELASRRGPHASGVAWEVPGGIAHARLVEPWSRAHDELLPKVLGSRRVIGHFRLSTSGAWRDPANAQPLPIGDGVIAHNGNVPAHVGLAVRDGIPLATDCDSELVGRWVEQAKGSLQTRVRRVLRGLGGPHVVLALWPGELAVARRELPLYEWRFPGGRYFCSVEPHADARLIEETMTRTAPEHHPISRVEWRDPKTLRANDYNPNRVFPQELELLKRSILEDGWTAPIVITAEGDIVDGFHRWTVAALEEIAALSGGLVPVVVLADVELVHRMMSTVRHNRARGQHGVLKMADIVRTAQGEGLSEDDICDGFGMEPEELDRLADMRPSPEQAGKDSFGRGWVPDPVGPNGASSR